MNGYNNRYVSPQNMFARVQANLDRRTEEIERGNEAMLGIYKASKGTYDFMKNYQLYKAGAMKSGIAPSFKEFALGDKSTIGKYVKEGQQLAQSLKIGKSASASVAPEVGSAVASGAEAGTELAAAGQAAGAVGATETAATATGAAEAGTAAGTAAGASSAALAVAAPLAVLLAIGYGIGKKGSGLHRIAHGGPLISYKGKSIFK